MARVVADSRPGDFERFTRARKIDMIGIRTARDVNAIAEPPVEIATAYRLRR